MLDKKGEWRTPPVVWERLKPLALGKRAEPTETEEKLWRFLRSGQLGGFKFRRQHAIDRYIVDFYCRAAKLVVEVDGPIHDRTDEEDWIREQYLEGQGLRVLRFRNEQVLTDLAAVLSAIANAVRHPLSGNGEGAGG